MSDTQAVIVLGSIVSFLITILGYFLHRLISGIDEGLKALKEEVYRDQTIITKHIDRLKTEIIVLQGNLQSTGISVTYIQKKMDDLEKIQEVVSSISNRVVATETKLDNFGKIIFRESRPKG